MKEKEKCKRELDGPGNDIGGELKAPAYFKQRGTINGFEAKRQQRIETPDRKIPE